MHGVDFHQPDMPIDTAALAEPTFATAGVGTHNEGVFPAAVGEGRDVQGKADGVDLGMITTGYLTSIVILRNLRCATSGPVTLVSGFPRDGFRRCGTYHHPTGCFPRAGNRMKNRPNKKAGGSSLATDLVRRNLLCCVAGSNPRDEHRAGSSRVPPGFRARHAGFALAIPLACPRKRTPKNPWNLIQSPTA